MYFQINTIPCPENINPANHRQRQRQKFKKQEEYPCGD
jgi:hypothetical protein